MKAWTVIAGGLGVALVSFAAVRAIPGDDASPGRPASSVVTRTPGPLGVVPVAGTLAPAQRTQLALMDQHAPWNQPFPGAGPEFSKEQRKAVDAVSQLALAGGQTRVVSVDKMSYVDAMCGWSSPQPSIGDVWVVWMEGPFRVSVPTIPQGVKLTEPWLPHHFDRQVFIVNALDYTSLQRFVEWPLKDCPRD